MVVYNNRLYKHVIIFIIVFEDRSKGKSVLYWVLRLTDYINQKLLRALSLLQAPSHMHTYNFFRLFTGICGWFINKTSGLPFMALKQIENSTYA